MAQVWVPQKLYACVLRFLHLVYVCVVSWANPSQTVPKQWHGHKHELMHLDLDSRHAHMRSWLLATGMACFISNNLPLNHDLKKGRLVINVGEERLLLPRLPAVRGEVAANAAAVAPAAPPLRGRVHAASYIVVVMAAAVSERASCVLSPPPATGLLSQLCGQGSCGDRQGKLWVRTRTASASMTSRRRGRGRRKQLS
jgi:hypothetical protein